MGFETLSRMMLSIFIRDIFQYTSRNWFISAKKEDHKSSNARKQVDYKRQLVKGTSGSKIFGGFFLTSV